ncbi:MAG TPA: hypothetical protein VF540_11845 [Segetibacter sp.]|jgi:hypothetical protein
MEIIKKLGIIVAVDILFIWAWIDSMLLDSSVSIVIIFFIPFLIILNLVIGVILKARRNAWANAILLNSIISSVIFYNFFVFAIRKQVSDNYKSFYFSRDGQNYELILNVIKGDYTNNESFEVYGRGKGSSWGIGLAGRYSVKEDTLILLTDSSKTMKVSNDILFDYPKVGDTIKLRTN